jgi:hypothetical protein
VRAADADADADATDAMLVGLDDFRTCTMRCDVARVWWYRRV